MIVAHTIAAAASFFACAKNATIHNSFNARERVRAQRFRIYRSSGLPAKIIDCSWKGSPKTTGHNIIRAIAKDDLSYPIADATSSLQQKTVFPRYARFIEIEINIDTGFAWIAVTGCPEATPSTAIITGNIKG
jgi:hypothetical protein